MLDFVQPDIVRIALSDGQFLDVKRELNAGESRAVWADMVVGGVRPGELANYDPRKVGLTRILAYLVGWSAVDPDGRPVPVSEGALLALSTASFREVSNAIDAHEEQQERAAEAKKKTRDTAPTLRAISG